MSLTVFNKKLTYLRFAKFRKDANVVRTCLGLIPRREFSASTPVTAGKQADDGGTKTQNEDSKGQVVETDIEPEERKPIMKGQDFEQEDLSFDQRVHMFAQMRMKKPTNFEKMCVMWNGKYDKIEDMPEYVSFSVINTSIDKYRIIQNMWMVGFLFFSSLTLIKLQQARVKTIHNSIEERQQAIFAERNKRFEAEYAQRKLKEAEAAK